MKCPWRIWLLVGLILGAMLALMWRPMTDDSATVDEPGFVAAAYTYWQGARYYFNAEHPPLAQLWSGVPLLWLDVQVPPGNEKLLEVPSPLPFVMTWTARKQPRLLVSADLPEFYIYPHAEASYYGQALLYRGVNERSGFCFGAGSCRRCSRC